MVEQRLDGVEWHSEIVLDRDGCRVGTQWEDRVRRRGWLWAGEGGAGDIGSVVVGDVCRYLERR